MSSISAITGLTLPGIIEEPGWTAGSVISASPVSGPELISRRSLAIRISSSASERSAPETCAKAAMLWVASTRLGAGRSGNPVSSAEPSHHRGRVVRMAVHARARRRRAEVQLVQVLRRASIQSARRAHRRAVGGELLAEPDRDGVLQVRAARLDHAVELDPLLAEGLSEVARRRKRRASIRSEASLIAVGKTSLVDWAMFTWSLGWTGVFVAALSAEKLAGSVGDDLVGVHVVGRAGARLEDVDHELVAEATRHYLGGGAGDGVGLAAVEKAEARVRVGGRLLDDGGRPDELRKRPEAADREVLDRPRRLGAIVGGGRHGHFAERVSLEANVSSADSGLIGRGILECHSRSSSGGVSPRRQRPTLPPPATGQVGVHEAGATGNPDSAGAVGYRPRCVVCYDGRGQGLFACRDAGVERHRLVTHLPSSQTLGLTTPSGRYLPLSRAIGQDAALVGLMNEAQLLPQLLDALPHAFAILSAPSGDSPEASRCRIVGANNAFASLALARQVVGAGRSEGSDGLVGRSLRQVLADTAYSALFDDLDQLDLSRADEPIEITRSVDETVQSVRLFRVGSKHVALLIQDVTNVRRAAETADRLIAELTASQRRSIALAAELRRANATLQTLIDTMPTGVVACDNSGRVILANPAIKEFVGGDVYERLYEKTDTYSIYHVDGPQFDTTEYPLLRTLKERTTIRDVEIEVRRKDGTSRVLLISASPVLDPSGELIGAIAVARDITGRKMAEETLKENEERFRLLYERAPLGYQSLDEAGRIIDVNQTWLETLGFERGDVMGHLFDDFLVPEHSQPFRDEFARLRDTGESRDAEFEMIRRDGTKLIVAFVGRVSYDEQGRFRQAHCILNDVTEQKRLEEQLLRASRLEMAGRIAGQVAHDLNNLLAPLVAYPELMRMQLPQEHPFQEYCETMLRSGQQISTISTNLLALGRRGHFSQETLDLNRLVHQVIDQMTDRPDSLAVIPELADDLLPVVGSAAQLVRVIVNLVANAREAMRDDGSLTLRTANVYLDRPFGRLNRVAVGEYVRLDVADSGPGIRPEVLSRMFEPFFSSKRADEQRGSGLGLSIVEAVVNDHRGYVDVETRIGEGATFSLFFPAARGAILPSESDLVPGQGESVLVVDDDSTQREVIGRPAPSAQLPRRSCGARRRGAHRAACRAGRPAPSRHGHARYRRRRAVQARARPSAGDSGDTGLRVRRVEARPARPRAWRGGLPPEAAHARQAGSLGPRRARRAAEGQGQPGVVRNSTEWLGSLASYSAVVSGETYRGKLCAHGGPAARPVSASAISPAAQPRRCASSIRR